MCRRSRRNGALTYRSRANVATNLSTHIAYACSSGTEPQRWHTPISLPLHPGAMSNPRWIAPTEPTVRTRLRTEAHLQVQMVKYPWSGKKSWRSSILPVFPLMGPESRRLYQLTYHISSTLSSFDVSVPYKRIPLHRTFPPW